MVRAFCVLACLLCCRCSSGSSHQSDRDAATDASAALDASAPDASLDAAAPDKAAGCAVLCEGDAGAPPAEAVCFGEGLTDAFGRLDGTVLAVQRPQDTECALPNDDHLIVQVLMNGEAYRMVVNVLSDGRNGTDTSLRFADVVAPLAEPAWAEGWHAGVALDYVSTLAVHRESFTPYPMDELVDQVWSRLEIGARVSVYGTSDGRPNAAHLIHRNRTDEDGAIVVNPSGAIPHFLLFHFDGQEF